MDREREGSDFGKNESLRHLLNRTVFLANDVTHGSQAVNVADANRCKGGRYSVDSDVDAVYLNDDDSRALMVQNKILIGRLFGKR